MSSSSIGAATSIPQFHTRPGQTTYDGMTNPHEKFKLFLAELEFDSFVNLLTDLYQGPHSSVPGEQIGQLRNSLAEPIYNEVLASRIKTISQPDCDQLLHKIAATGSGIFTNTLLSSRSFSQSILRSELKDAAIGRKLDVSRVLFRKILHMNRPGNYLTAAAEKAHALLFTYAPNYFLNAEILGVVLDQAAEAGDKELTEELIKNANGSIPFVHLVKAISLAIDKGHDQVAEAILSVTDSSKINQPHLRSRVIGDIKSMFNTVAKNGNEKIAATILGGHFGAEIDSTSALLNAATNGHKKIVQMIVDYQYSIFSRPVSSLVNLIAGGATGCRSPFALGPALEKAAENGHQDVVAILLKEVNGPMPAQNVQNAIANARRNGHVQIAATIEVVYPQPQAT